MKKVFSILALLLPLIVGEVQAQKNLPSKHGFEQSGKSANARGGAECDNCQNAKQTERLESPLDRCPGTYRRGSQRHHTHIGHRQLERNGRQL